MNPEYLLDEYENYMERAINPFQDPMFEDPLSRTLSKLEFGIENPFAISMEPVLPQIQQNLPVDVYHKEPPKVTMEYVQNIEMSKDHVSNSFFPGLMPHVDFRIRGSRNGARASSDEIFCFKEHQYLKEKECKENDCQYWDEDDYPHCTYLSEEERHGEDE